MWGPVCFCAVLLPHNITLWGSSPWFKTPSAGQSCPNPAIILQSVHMDCFHEVAASSDLQLHGDVKDLAPKHYKYVKKLPKI